MEAIEFRSMDDVRGYVQRVSERKWTDSPDCQRVQTLKWAAWLYLLAVAYLQYYYVGVTIDMLGLPDLTVNLDALPRKISALVRWMHAWV